MYLLSDDKQTLERGEEGNVCVVTDCSKKTFPKIQIPPGNGQQHFEEADIKKCQNKTKAHLHSISHTF